jgi:two-component system alkaline phosphatase synthesis response regulator PhoP
MDVNDVKILLVDDETDVLDFMKYNLEKEGFWVYTARDGMEGIQVAKKMNPHLIILDLMMPKLDGIETCRELRTMPEFKNTLITFLTARDEDYSHQATGFYKPHSGFAAPFGNQRNGSEAYSWRY